MERLVGLSAVLAFVSFCHTSTQHSVGTVVVEDGRVGIGLITGGNFGPGSFSIGGSHGSRPQPSVYLNDDDKDGQHIIIQTATQKGQQENFQNGDGNTQLYPVKHLTTHIKPQQGGNGGKVGSGGGQILVGAVVLNYNKHKKGNKKKNGNHQPEFDKATIEAIFGNNGGNNGLPSSENGFTGEDGSIQIGSITGGNFEGGINNINNKNEPATNMPQKKSSVNNGHTGNTEAQYIRGHANNNGAGKAAVGSNHGQTNWGHSEEPWIWER